MSTTSTGSSSSSRSGRAPPAVRVPEGAAEVAAALRALGVRPSKIWGQSFLTDAFVADAEAALTEVSPGRPVLEVGGGLGALTAALVRRGLAPITVLERDPRLAGFLRTTFGSRVRVVTGDALEVELPSVDCAIGNLPYSVATPILVRLLERRVPRIVALVQREVADRLAAPPGSKAYGRLSIFARLYGDVELFRTVGADAFAPRPEVESRLVVLVARTGELPVPSVADLEAMVRTLFSSRRKQLGNLLPRVAGDRDAARRLAERAGWPDDWATRRPETLSPSDYFAMARVLKRPPRSGPPRAKP